MCQRRRLKSGHSRDCQRAHRQIRSRTVSLASWLLRAVMQPLSP